MNRKTERGELQRFLDFTNLAVGTWSPGDGQTRYRFFLRDASGSPHADYHEGDGLYTALGRGEAVTWLRGYNAALVNARPSHTTHALRAELRKASGVAPVIIANADGDGIARCSDCWQALNPDGRCPDHGQLTGGAQ